MSTMETEGRTVVQNADRMDLETFCLHMSIRHADCLGGLRELRPEAQSDYTEELWRLFHDKVHGPLLGHHKLDHDHGRP